MDRRKFLKSFGLLAGAVIVAPSILAETKKQPREPLLHLCIGKKGVGKTYSTTAGMFSISIKNKSTKMQSNVSVQGLIPHSLYGELEYRINGDIINPYDLHDYFKTREVLIKTLVVTGTQSTIRKIISMNNASYERALYSPSGVIDSEFRFGRQHDLKIWNMEKDAEVHFVFHLKPKSKPYTLHVQNTSAQPIEAIIFN